MIKKVTVCVVCFLIVVISINPQPVNAYVGVGIAELERQAIINSMLYGLGLERLNGQSYQEWVTNNDNLKSIKVTDWMSEAEWKQIQSSRIDKATGQKADTFEIGKDYLYYVPPQGLYEKAQLLQSKIRYDTEANAFFKYDREVYRGNFIDSNGRIYYAGHTFDYDVIPGKGQIQEKFDILKIKVVNCNLLADSFYQPQGISEISGNYEHQEEYRDYVAYTYSETGITKPITFTFRSHGYNVGCGREFIITNNHNGKMLRRSLSNGDPANYGNGKNYIYNFIWYPVNSLDGTDLYNKIYPMWCFILKEKTTNELYVLQTFDDTSLNSNNYWVLPTTAVDNKDNELLVLLNQQYLLRLMEQLSKLNKNKVIPVSVSTVMPRADEKDKVGTIVLPANPSKAIDLEGEKEATQEGVGSGTGSNSFNPDIPDFDLPSVLMNKFPFCIPFDLYNVFANLKVDEKPPKWVIPILSTQIVLDFSQFGVWAKIIKWGFLIVFLVGLIILTRRIIKG